jgi:hypothetical protein
MHRKKNTGDYEILLYKCNTVRLLYNGLPCMTEDTECTRDTE